MKISSNIQKHMLLTMCKAGTQNMSLYIYVSNNQVIAINCRIAILRSLLTSKCIRWHLSCSLDNIKDSKLSIKTPSSTSGPLTPTRNSTMMREIKSANVLQIVKCFETCSWQHMFSITFQTRERERNIEIQFFFCIIFFFFCFTSLFIILVHLIKTNASQDYSFQNRIFFSFFQTCSKVNLFLIFCN